MQVLKYIMYTSIIIIIIYLLYIYEIYNAEHTAIWINFNSIAPYIHHRRGDSFIAFNSFYFYCKLLQTLHAMICICKQQAN